MKISFIFKVNVRLVLLLCFHKAGRFFHKRSRFFLVFTKKVSPEREPNVSSFENFADNCDSCEMLGNTDNVNNCIEYQNIPQDEVTYLF